MGTVTGPSFKPVPSTRCFLVTKSTQQTDLLIKNEKSLPDCQT